MLHILLLILKIIGIIFAAILGILVLLVCIVLFVPIRYDVEASCDGTLGGIHASARVTWLLHLIRLNVCYEKQELSWRIRIAWKNMQNGQEDNKKIKKEVETYDKEMEELWESMEKSMEEESQKNLEIERDLEEEPQESSEIERNLEKNEKNPGETKKEEKSEKSYKNVQDNVQDSEEKADTVKELEEAETGILEELKEGERDSKEERKGIWQKIAGNCEKVIQKIKGLYKKIAGIPEKVKDTIENISEKIKAFIEKKNKIFDFLSDEVHKKAFLKVKDEGFLLLRKLKPKKFLAEFHYGFDDPCLTGKILAGFSVFYPFLEENVKVYPDFGQQVLEGQVSMIGKIRISYFVKILWNLIWCKEVRMTYRHVKSFKL